MKKELLHCMVLAAGLLGAAAESGAQGGKAFTVKVNEVKAPIQPTMWGVFFEDINFGADGGIYAELVKNRSFEFTKPMMGWSVQGSKREEGDLLVMNRQDKNTSNPRFLRVKGRSADKGALGMVNEGFRGMGVKKDLRYDFSVMYRQQQPGVQLRIELQDEKGKAIGGTVLTPKSAGNGWQKESVSFTASATDQKAKLAVWFEGTGVLDVDMLSLFPSDTWKGRPGGMRADMIQMLADMKPGFIRFPGGCIVEGHDLSVRYQWKKTIGPVEERQLIINRWNHEFAHRPAPDYFQTFGLGFFEYFQIAEDIGAEPLPILNAGMACQFNTAEVVPMDQLDPYVQDALDLIEFANGDTATKWGKVRARLGHPAPFNLKMMGIGNENWGPQYIERLEVFTKAIKARYPEMKLVNSSGTDPDGSRFDYLDTTLRKMNADIIDEHYYRRPEWFLENAKRYDQYDRKGAKIFAGEYAAQSDKTVSIHNKNNWLTALSEAAFMTGLERNADVVVMASYAPLFAHSEGWQWTPDLIWVDNLRTVGTPNYYVQKLFSTNRGTHTVPLLMNNEAVAGQDSLYASASIDRNTNELIVKVVNAGGVEQAKELSVEGVKKLASKGKSYVIRSSPEMVNALDKPQLVQPVEQDMNIRGKKLQVVAAPYSFTVIRVKLS